MGNKYLALISEQVKGHVRGEVPGQVPGAERERAGHG